MEKGSHTRGEKGEKDEEEERKEELGDMGQASRGLKVCWRSLSYPRSVLSADEEGAGLSEEKRRSDDNRRTCLGSIGKSLHWTASIASPS